MGLRSNPSQRQRRLGAELRRLRELSGMSATDAGALAGLGRAHMSHIEMGRTAIPEEKLRTLAHAYGCNSHDFVDALVAMGRATGKGWWTDFRDTHDPSALDFAELEASSATIKTFQVMFVPGLLQTAAYTRALFEAGEPNAEPALFDRYVQFRQRRKHVLVGESPPQFHAVIHETAIRMSFMGADILREQLEHLIEMALMPHVHIQIMPLAAPVFPAADRPFVIYDPGLAELSTVHVEHPVSTAFLGDQSYLVQYADAFDRLTGSALLPMDPKTDPGVYAKRDSIGLIQHLLYLL